MRNTNTSPKYWALATLSISLIVTGCAADDPSEPESVTDTDLIPMTIGVLPIAPSVAVKYGVEEGIFEEHGFDVEITRANSGAAMLPAVANNQIDIGVGNPLSVLIANDSGLDIRVMTGYSNSLSEGEDINGIVTRSESDIESYADLAGSNVAINQLQSQGDLTIMEMTDAEGADPEAIEFSEIPFVEMPGHLEQGNVDAVWVPEPFLSDLLSDDAYRLVGFPNQEAIPGLPTMVTFASGDFVTKQPEVVEAFGDAMTDVLSQASANEDDAKALLGAFMELPTEVAEQLRMEEWNGEIQEAQLQALADLAVKFDYVSEAPDIASIATQ